VQNVTRFLQIFWRIDPLIGNDRETNNDTTAVVRQRSAPMAVHATMDITMPNSVCYAVHAEVL
jgi:hypothetical protein